MRQAKNYDAWKKAAIKMDEFLGFSEWKEVDEDPNYDWNLVRKVKRSLASLRKQGDVRGLMDVLEVCLRSNFAGVESVRIYSEVSEESKFGT